MLSKKKILIAEDNLLNREMLAEILSDQYEVLQAENGREALKILEREKDSVSLILLDVMMPEMDGYTFLDYVKKDEELALLPVIVMTQSDGEEDEISALEHGATDFVPKPYRPRIILHRIASLIKFREEAAIANQFRYDRLTGLYSKDYFCQKVEERLSENPEKEYSIICSNIENFKLFNDVFGSKEGDRLLKEIAKIAKKMVGDKGFCGRYGADHFICLQERNQEELDRKNFGLGNWELSPLMKNIVMRWGIYEITDRSVPVEQMCDRAMLAVTGIKGQYNRFFSIYDDSLRSKLLREKAITDAMVPALEEKQFTVYLQPKYSLKDRCMIGAEALVRWNHPEWGRISPGEFIPLFEKNGFIFRLDQYVWEWVCALLSEWKSKGYPLIPISVNVSRADVYQSDLSDILLGLTQKYGIDPAYLHLEITESAYAKNPDLIVGTVNKLRKQGFVIEMDDFGSGYSSLNMLSQMKLDVLKLDMNFIQQEIEKPMSQNILDDVITMAHKMRLSVVAEGVETQEQMNRLQEAGCDYVQGYFFAKPMPVAEFEELCREQFQSSMSPLPADLPHESQKRSLLVVDPDEEYREKVRQTFEENFQIVEATDLQSAIDCIRAGGKNDFSAVILSIALPDNGADFFLKALRQDPAFWELPVLAVISSVERAEELKTALETDDFLCKLHPMSDLRKRIQRLIYMAESHRRERALQDEAQRDYMTGLLNRRGIQTAMKSLSAEDLPLALCLFDIDKLKEINDTLGHDAGDRFIRGFADVLRNNTGKDDILCRYGGDEFLVILKHVADAESAIVKANEICRAFQGYFKDEQPFTSCSGGISLCGKNDVLSDVLIEQADQALYRAKQEKGGGCYVFDKSNR